MQWKYLEVWHLVNLYPCKKRDLMGSCSYIYYLILYLFFTCLHRMESQRQDVTEMKCHEIKLLTFKRNNANSEHLYIKCETLWIPIYCYLSVLQFKQTNNTESFHSLLVFRNVPVRLFYREPERVTSMWLQCHFLGTDNSSSCHLMRAR